MRAELNDRVNVTLAEFPLTVLLSTAVPSFQFTLTYDRFASASTAFTVIEYAAPVCTLAPLVVPCVSAGG
ncbi:hypothetical protein GALL_449540 [mine drainage metagenome]|uniref:Uncharacterized protein n=1 Tax=mine drainage metagenome TaxID=410659 RepID=A0A1J5PPK1_9ZZZZ